MQDTSCTSQSSVQSPVVKPRTQEQLTVVPFQNVKVDSVCHRTLSLSVVLPSVQRDIVTSLHAGQVRVYKELCHTNAGFLGLANSAGVSVTSGINTNPGVAPSTNALVCGTARSGVHRDTVNAGEGGK